jgi:DNA topoisomerase VI subunit B
LYRFANKIPLLYDEGADVAKEVISEVALNKMGISKKQVKEQFSNLDSRSDRAIDLLPFIYFSIFARQGFHIRLQGRKALHQKVN